MNTLQLIKPIIIVGSGRSGTTIFYNMLVRHPNIAYPTGLCEKHPDKLYLNRWFMKLMDIPFLEETFMKKHGPAECINYCAHSNPAFYISSRDLTENNITPKMKKRCMRISLKY